MNSAAYWQTWLRSQKTPDIEKYRLPQAKMPGGAAAFKTV